MEKFSLALGLNEFYNLIDSNGFEILNISIEHALQLSELEFIHRDPFDRLLIAQSISDNIFLVTKDQHIQRYSVKTIW